MGCVQSRIEKEEAVARCKKRRQLMREAVSQRNTFASAHSAYAMILKNVGGALSVYGRGEVLEPLPIVDTTPVGSLPQPPRPPPHPDDFVRSPPDLQRSMQPLLPEVAFPEGGADVPCPADYIFGVSDHMTRMLPEMEETPKQSMELTVSVTETKRARGRGVNLIHILDDLDDQFLKASESGQRVTKMLAARRLHYHSNFADNRGHIDHSAEVMRAITWNRSFKGIRQPDFQKVKLEAEESETHATVLDELLAWEQKLFDEVKEVEMMKIEYRRKLSLLNRQKKKGVSANTLEKAKVAAEYFHTRYTVDVQSMESTLSEIYRLRDELLYPRLVEFVKGMATMWKTMYLCHVRQKSIVNDFRLLDISNNASRETILQSHHERTEELCNVTSAMGLEFQKLHHHQKDYVRTLNSWVLLSLIPIENDLKPKKIDSSPPRHDVVIDPPIRNLIGIWNSEIERLPEEATKNAIISFAAVVKAIFTQQKEDLNQRHKWEDAKREDEKKLQSFHDWREKYLQRKHTDNYSEENDRIMEKRECQVNISKTRMEKELESYKELCRQTREKSLGSLKTALPDLLNAMAEFSCSCLEAYRKLWSSIRSTQPQHAEKST